MFSLNQVIGTTDFLQGTRDTHHAEVSDTLRRQWHANNSELRVIRASHYNNHYLPVISCDVQVREEHCSNNMATRRSFDQFKQTYL